MAQKKIGFFSPHITPLTHLQKHLKKNTFPEVQRIKFKDNKHLAHLKKQNMGSSQQFLVWSWASNWNPKVSNFSNLSFHQNALYKSFLPGSIPFIPFIRDPGPNPNPMILPHVLELNGSKKLPNLRGGIIVESKKVTFWPDDDMREKVVQNVCFFFVYFFF